jgi:hypothetical protein
MTENHQYNTPKKGATDWHIPLNENFKLLDNDVEVRDVEANLSEYTPTEGAKFLALDTGVMFVGTGSEWTHFGDIRRVDGNVAVQAEAPSVPEENDLWVDISTPALRYYDGSSWVSVTGSDSSDTSTSDGTGTVEDGERDLTQYDGDVSYYSITSNALSGNGSILAKGVEHEGYRTIVSTSGLTRYPSQADTFQVDVSVDTKNTYGSILFGVQSDLSPWPSYRLRLDTGASPGIEFERVPIDGPVESHNLTGDYNLWDNNYHDNADYEPTVGEKYTVRVDWQTDGTLAVTITDSTGGVLLDATASDSNYTGGGIGFMSSSSWSGQDNNEVRFDNFKIV